MQLHQLLLVRCPLLTELVLLQEATHDVSADAIWCVLVQSETLMQTRCMRTYTMVVTAKAAMKHTDR